jgi:hypothetical protein
LKRVTAQYLARYAEPEARIADGLSRRYECALVVPACRESSHLLNGYDDALRAGPAPSLVVLVVNGAVDADERTHSLNSALILALTGGGKPAIRVSHSPPGWLIEHGEHHLLLIDRATPRHQLPARQGVGLARRIGCDIALSLYEKGKLIKPWFFSTDADVKLPPDYFGRAAGWEARGGPASALLYPFRHGKSSDPELEQATQIYEVSLRYYVLGLAWAGSPYAFQSVGSSIAVHAESYAAVRGFPQRLAGEDFYLLEKLAKVDPVARLRGGPIEIQTRHSDRTPFGTGHGVGKIQSLVKSGSDFTLDHPDSFGALRAWLGAVDAFCEEPEARVLREGLASLEAPLQRASVQALEASGAFTELLKAAQQARPGSALARRAHTWFDSLRTLKFLHALRGLMTPLPWRKALGQARFCSGLGVDAGSAEPGALSELLLAREAEQSSVVGPTLAR